MEKTERKLKVGCGEIGQKVHRNRTRNDSGPKRDGDFRN